MLRIASYNTQCQLYSFRPAGCTPLSPSLSLFLFLQFAGGQPRAFLPRIYTAFLSSLSSFRSKLNQWAEVTLSEFLAAFDAWFLLFTFSSPPFLLLFEGGSIVEGGWKKDLVCTDVCIWDVYSGKYGEQIERLVAKAIFVRFLFFFFWFTYALNYCLLSITNYYYYYYRNCLYFRTIFWNWKEKFKFMKNLSNSSPCSQNFFQYNFFQYKLCSELLFAFDNKLLLLLLSKLFIRFFWIGKKNLNLWKFIINSSPCP